MDPEGGEETCSSSSAVWVGYPRSVLPYGHMPLASVKRQLMKHTFPACVYNGPKVCLGPECVDGICIFTWKSWRNKYKLTEMMMTRARLESGAEEQVREILPAWFSMSGKGDHRRVIMPILLTAGKLKWRHLLYKTEESKVGTNPHHHHHKSLNGLSYRFLLPELPKEEEYIRICVALLPPLSSFTLSMKRSTPLDGPFLNFVNVVFPGNESVFW